MNPEELKEFIRLVVKETLQESLEMTACGPDYLQSTLDININFDGVPITGISIWESDIPKDQS